MPRYRIKPEYPHYTGGQCIPVTIYFVEMLKKGWLRDSWIKIKGFDRRERAEELKKQLEGLTK